MGTQDETNPTLHVRPASLLPVFALPGRSMGNGHRTLARGLCLYTVCDTHVPVHKDAMLPMGTPASPELRPTRMRAHEALYRLMERSGMSRKQP